MADEGVPYRERPVVLWSDLLAFLCLRGTACLACLGALGGEGGPMSSSTGFSACQARVA